MTITSEDFKIYVTYDEYGSLDGCYKQIPPPEHVNRLILVTEEQSEVWVTFRANSDRNGLEISPIVEPIIPAPAVPKYVTMRQARLALLQAGKLSSVDPAIASLPSPQKEQAQIEWEFSSSVERNREMTRLIGAALGMTENDLDDLFVLAASL